MLEEFNSLNVENEMLNMKKKKQQKRNKTIIKKKKHTQHTAQLERSEHSSTKRNEMR